MIRFARLLTFSLTLVFGGLAGAAEAQQPSSSYWGTDNCLHSWDGRAYSITGCRVYVTPHIIDYWDPQTRQWIVRIDDNPANRHIDYVYLQGPGKGGGLRFLRARPGEAVPSAPIAYKTAQGPWTATPEATTWAPQGPNPRTNNPMAGCPTMSAPTGRVLTAEEKRCFDQMGAIILGPVIRSGCQAPPDLTPQQQQDYQRLGRLPEGWTDSHQGPVRRQCR